MYDQHHNHIRFADVSTGVRLAYEDSGLPTGAPVVCVHGFTDSHRSFDLLRQRMPRGVRMLAPTMRGHGDSAKPAHGYAIQTMADDVAAFLDAMNVPRAVIVGHSMGSAIAMHLAARHPARVAGVALIGAFADLGANPGVGELIAAVEKFADTVDPAFVRAFQESCLARPAPQDSFVQVLHESAKTLAHVWKSASRGFLSADLAAVRRRIRAPALIVWGEKDAFCPYTDQIVLRDGLPRARLVSMEGVGHTPHWEAPGETAEALTAFLAGLEDSWWA